MSMEDRRTQLRNLYRDLFDRVSAVLFAADPIGLNFEDNADEYDPEVTTILPQLRTCLSADDVRDLLHREFVRQFDEHTAGPPGLYTEPARQIWELWQQHLGRRDLP